MGKFIRGGTVTGAVVIIGCLAASLSTTAAAAPSGAADFASHCAGCHSLQPGKNGVGPSLAGVYGRTSGGAPGYSYSHALQNAHLVWNDQDLEKFLQNPSSVAPGTKMFVSVPDAATRQQIIAYLKDPAQQSASAK